MSIWICCECEKVTDSIALIKGSAYCRKCLGVVKRANHA